MQDDIKDNVTGKCIKSLISSGSKDGEKMDECCGWTPATATAAVAAVALGAVAAAAAAAPPRLLCVCRKPSEARRSQALKES